MCEKTQDSETITSTFLETFPFFELPGDLKLAIVSWLDIPSFSTFSQVCRSSSQLCTTFSAQFWRMQCEHIYGHEFSSIVEKHNRRWTWLQIAQTLLPRHKMPQSETNPYRIFVWRYYKPKPQFFALVAIEPGRRGGDGIDRYVGVVEAGAYEYLKLTPIFNLCPSLGCKLNSTNSTCTVRKLVPDSGKILEETPTYYLVQSSKKLIFPVYHSFFQQAAPRPVEKRTGKGKSKNNAFCVDKCSIYFLPRGLGYDSHPIFISDDK